MKTIDDLLKHGDIEEPDLVDSWLKYTRQSGIAFKDSTEESDIEVIMYLGREGRIALEEAQREYNINMHKLQIELNKHEQQFELAKTKLQQGCGEATSRKN